MSEVSSLRPHGVLIASDPDGGETQYDTKQCCHCNHHFVMQKGSGRKRGFCRGCMQVTCGSPACDRCLPWEKKMELAEAGKAILL